MFRSPVQCATWHLQFLDEMGAVLRLTEARRPVRSFPSVGVCLLLPRQTTRV